MNFILNNLAKASVYLAKNGFNCLFPLKCLCCQTELEHKNLPVCDDCYVNLPFQPHSCRQCGQAFAADSDICGRCLASSPQFDACFCPFEYKGAIKTQIQRFKYQQHPELSTGLAQLLASEIDAHQIKQPELLIPVPLHLKRLRQRGFNQSLLLAKALSKQMNIPVSRHIIRKSKHTQVQATLSLKQRAQNLKGSFKINKTVKAQSVAIIDDVVTTGSTVKEIAEILKENGVHYVQVWGLARTN